MSHPRPLINLVLVAVLGLVTIAPARTVGTPYQTGLAHWDAASGGFARWARSGVTLAPDGTLRLDPQTAVAATDPDPPGGY